MNAHSISLVLLCSLLVAGCELLGIPSFGGSSRSIDADAGDFIELEIGQTAVLDDLDAEIQFVEVGEDSRCPIGVDCVWAGRVRASFELAYQGGEHPITFEGFVGGTDEGDSLLVEVEDLNIVLKALAPYPVYEPSTGRSTRGRTATLVITRD